MGILSYKYLGGQLIQISIHCKFQFLQIFTATKFFWYVTHSVIAQQQLS